MALLRMLLLLGIALTVIYVIASLYFRSQCRTKLEKGWAEEGSIGSRDDYVDRGLKEYDRSFGRRLLLGIYIVPLLTIGVLVYLSNYA